MILRVAMENSFEGRTIAWALEHPGCFTYGRNEQDATREMPAAFQDYIDWIAQHSPKPWLSPGDIDLHVEETWQVYCINDDFELATEGYEVNAWFLFDWKPLTEQEITRGMMMLSWSRTDLLAEVSNLDQEALDFKHPGERWSIAGILKHIGGAEWWYLDRLDLAFERPQVPEDPFERLEVVRSHLMTTLPNLAGSRQVVGKDGEFWSPRKLLRRALWHERDHRVHINRLRQLAFSSH